MKVDAESRKYLEEVRKGKPRRFVMVCNGVKILNLIVYKKGSESRYKNQARKADGAGQFFSGVITGKGRNIVFELSRQEHERPPGKDILLRQFLEEEAELSCRPSYQLVDTLTAIEPSDVVEDESELPNDDPDAAPQADGEAATPPAESAAAEGESAERNTPATSPTDPEPIDASPPQQASRPSADETVEPPGEQRRKEKAAKVAAILHEAIDDLRPGLHDVIETHPDTEEDLLDEFSDIVDQITRQDFTAARQRIAELTHALKVLAQRPPRGS